MKAISFFPTPYEDEDFRSLVYRYHIRVGYKQFVSTNQELFNSKLDDVNTHLTKKALTLFAHLQKDYGMYAEQILRNHTLWALSEPFSTNSKARRINGNMLENYNNLTNNQVVRIIDLILSPIIRYCPHCLSEDYHKNGECYLHRLHQISFIDICHRHKIRLITHCSICGVELSNKKRNKLLVEPYCSNGHYLSDYPIAVEGDELKLNLGLINDCLLIMEGPKYVDSTFVDHQFLTALFNRGYILPNGSIKFKTLFEDFKNTIISNQFGGSEFLSCILERKSMKRLNFLRGWISKGQPIHLMLMRFLAGSVYAFLYDKRIPVVTIPFGFGPWVCVNSICPDYNTPSIKKAERTLINGGRLSISFRCPTCGMTYVETCTPSIDSTIESPKSPNIKIVGYLWKSKLIEDYSNGLSVKEIAIHLNTSYSAINDALLREFKNSRINTINDVATKELKLCLNEVAATISEDDRRSIECRQKVFDQVKLNISRSEIKKHAKKEYIWLMLHERAWMERNMPQKKYGTKRLNWEIIDFELVEKVKVSAKRVYDLNLPRRVKRQTIIDSLSEPDRSHLLQGPQKVPKSWAVLIELIESEEKYVIRSIPRVVNYLLRHGCSNVTLSGILGHSRYYHRCSDVVKNEIIEVLRNMGFRDVENGSEGTYKRNNLLKKSD